MSMITKKLSLSLTRLLIILLALSCNGVDGTLSAQTLLFSDEFNGTSLDTTKWAQYYDDRSGDMRYSNWPNGEAQWYKPENNVVENGYLRQIAKKESTVGAERTYHYSSGIITSRKSFNFTYGYFVARVWLCPGHGFWPALWVWPRGEIDAFEFYGDNVRRLYLTNHVRGPGRGHHISTSDDWTKGWHIIGADWQEGYVNFYIDDELQWSSPGSSNALQYLILNLAIANGKGAPEPNEKTVFPSEIKWDWIRVYSEFVPLLNEQSKVD
jgi:beta-glucanase (GH16 family)